ncbi:Protein PAM71 chloroplastic [Bienertia sinuspersici]
MKTVTLSTSPHPLFGSRNIINGRTSFHSTDNLFSLHRRISSSFQWRASSKQCNPKQEVKFRLFGQKAWQESNELECGHNDKKGQHKHVDLCKNQYDIGASNLLSASYLCRADDNVADMGKSVSYKSTQQLLKFVFLFGILTIQSSGEASATSNFIDSLQSTNFFGDLSDISTGFASALLAARNSATVVFAGTFGALAIMTIISVILGRTFHFIDDALPFSFGGSDLPIDDIAAVCLLVYFGVTTLVDATSSDSQKAEDEQKEAELAVSEFSGNGAGILAAAGTIISTFTLVFVAEWGDKSFFSTIALAAASSPLGVIGGALAGHGAATLLAVAGGSLLGNFLSEKAISYVGGVLFLVFAGITLIEIVQG